MKGLRIIKKVLPSIEINFDEVKEGLKQQLSKYEGIVVTEETLLDCVTIQKEMSRLRRDIDGKRLDVQRETKKPLDAFGAQMKELMALVIEVEDPIKKGMQVFEDKRIEEKTTVCEELVSAKLSESGLSVKFQKVVVDSRWMNKGLTIKEIGEDIDGQIIDQLSLQNVHEENAKAIREILKGANEGLTTPLDADYYIGQLDTGAPLSAIMGSISNDSGKRKEAEERAVQAADTEKTALAPPRKGPEAPGGAGEAHEPVTRTVTIKVTATDEKLADLGAFLKSNQIAYEKVG